jgi:tetratricopeptide (TPR) repeat protein
VNAAHQDGPPARLGSLVVPRQLPAAASCFVGRASELKTLSALLDHDPDGPGPVAVSVISGTAGVGKTTLAVQWAHQVAERFPDGQLYADLRGFGPAGSPASPGEVLRGFLEAFGVPPGHIPATLDGLTGLYRSLLHGRRVLVVLDNARDAAQVRPLLPGAPGCAAVVSSRGNLTGLVAADGAQPLMLDVLTDSESRELLERRLGPERLAGEEAAAAQLTRLCARLPLALSITAARAAAHPQARLTVLASELDAAAASLEELNALDTGDAATSIRAALSWSYASLGADAGRMFRLLALHPGADISVPAAASLAGLRQQQASELLRALTSASLLTEPVPGRFGFHDLLRSYATELARADRDDGEDRAAFHRLLDHYLHTASAAAKLSQHYREPLTLRPPRPGTFPEQLANGEAALAWFNHEHENLRPVIARAAADGFDAHAWQIGCTLVPFIARSGRWQQPEWTTLLSTALAAAQRHGDPSGQARLQWETGLVQNRLGRYDDALSHFSLALGLYRKLGDVSGQAHVHLGLAQMFDRQHRGTDAVWHAERALGLYRQAGNRLGEAEALNDAGWYSAKAGDLQHALGYCQQALEIQQAASGPLEANTLDSVGYIHHQMGHYPEAIAAFGRSLGILRGLADRYHEAVVLTHLGDTKLAAGDQAGARDTWHEALAILVDIGDPTADEIRARLRTQTR